MWAKRDNGDYVNIDLTTRLSTTGSGSSWTITASWPENGTVTVTLAGTWSSQADAQEAIRKLVDAVDPSTY